MQRLLALIDPILQLNALRTGDRCYANWCIPMKSIDSDRERQYTVTQQSAWHPLFVQQELAIASFLELPLVAFHHSSVGLQGVAKYLHVNSIEFSTVVEILEHLGRQTAQWSSESKNQLRLSWGKEDVNVFIVNREKRPLSNWYHIQVENLSAVFRAKNCYCYIESIDDLRAGKQVFGKDEYKNELIWAGTRYTSVDIQRQAKKVIDALYTVHGSGKWSMNEENTSTIYRYPSLKDGKYKIKYAVHSDNFPTAEIEIQVFLTKDQLELMNQKQIE